MPTLTIRHITTYRYRQPVAFGEHDGRDLLCPVSRPPSDGKDGDDSEIEVPALVMKDLVPSITHSPSTSRAVVRIPPGTSEMSYQCRPRVHSTQRIRSTLVPLIASRQVQHIPPAVK